MANQLDIVGEIKKYWKDKATGALFLKLVNDRLLQIFFSAGEIQSIKYHGSSGMDVINEIPNLEGLKSQFHPGATSKFINKLPKTADIIDICSSGGANKKGSASVSSGALRPEQKELVEQIFMSYVGPIGGLIFSEHVASANSLGPLVEALSGQISDASDQARFKDEVESAIRAAM